MNNKTRAEEHLLPPSKEEDKGERSRRDPDSDLVIFLYSITGSWSKSPFWHGPAPGEDRQPWEKVLHTISYMNLSWPALCPNKLLKMSQMMLINCSAVIRVQPIDLPQPISHVWVMYWWAEVGPLFVLNPSEAGMTPTPHADRCGSGEAGGGTGTSNVV